jgi:hypothetical protein
MCSFRNLDEAEDARFLEREGLSVADGLVIAPRKVREAVDR